MSSSEYENDVIDYYLFVIAIIILGVILLTLIMVAHCLRKRKYIVISAADQDSIFNTLSSP